MKSYQLQTRCRPSKLKNIIQIFKKAKIRTSLFINPSIRDIKLSSELNVDCVEIHTGKLSNLVKLKKNFNEELNRINFTFEDEKKNKKLHITEVTSPTFNLLNEYEINDLVIKHYDLFRLTDKSDIKNLDLFENNQNTITLIEWPQLISKNKSIKTIDLIFSYENELNNRSVKIDGLN